MTGAALMLAVALHVVTLPTFYQAGHYLHTACGTKSMTLRLRSGQAQIIQAGS